MVTRIDELVSETRLVCYQYSRLINIHRFHRQTVEQLGMRLSLLLPLNTPILLFHLSPPREPPCPQDHPWSPLLKRQQVVTKGSLKHWLEMGVTAHLALVQLSCKKLPFQVLKLLHNHLMHLAVLFCFVECKQLSRRLSRTKTSRLRRGR